MKNFTLLAILISAASTASAQQQPTVRSNTITTAVPFLNLDPDARSGAMGSAGTATSPDANSLQTNASKLGFAEKDMSFSLSYTPWLRALVPDINLWYASGYKKINETNVIGASFKYFSLGEVTYTSTTGVPLATYKPREFAADVSYAKKLGDNFSAGIGLRYIHSDLTGNMTIGSYRTHAGTALAGDISAYWQSYFEPGIPVIWSWGINISNIGNKVSYTDTILYGNLADTRGDFLPANLRLGTAGVIDLATAHKLCIAIDANKLLVPSPPRYEYNPNGQQVITAGMDPNRSVLNALYTSFSDAPGGSEEELEEINYSAGMEYSFQEMLFVRGGYFFESPTKGNREFFSAGMGVRYKTFQADLYYLIPTEQRNPLENTVGFTLSYLFDKAKLQKPVSTPLPQDTAH